MGDDIAQIPEASVAESSDGARCLVRVAAAIAALDENSVRREMEAAHNRVDAALVEEVILQSYLFAGFPRALNAARIWRSFVTEAPPATLEQADDLDRWREQGKRTCATVYGASYEKLRDNICALHPLLDDWMITEGYGKVLSRPLLNLKLRELCIVAACAASGQQRQLHSHLRGALNAGVAPESVDFALDSLADLIPMDRLVSYKLLFARVRRGGSDVH